MNDKSMCFICDKNIAVLKEYNIAKHYNLKLQVHKLCRSPEKIWNVTFNMEASEMTECLQKTIHW
jgi:hypothetical protein